MRRKHFRRNPKPTLFGRNLRALRLAVGWSQDRMAQYLGLSSRVMISWYESGIVGRPSLQVLGRFRELEAASCLCEAAKNSKNR